jgi:peptidyl-prolyl cis-trans isomerase B (cyclophilin B)
VAGNKDRERRLARERYRRQQEQRMERARKLRRRAAVITSACVVIALGLGSFFLFTGGSGKSAAASPTATATASATASPTPTAIAESSEPLHTCTYAKSGTAAKTVGLPSATPDYAAKYTATIKTNRGNIVINLLNSKATCTVNSFVHLIDKGYYNNTQCHRMVTSGIFVLQCGDPYATAATKITCSTTSLVGQGTPGYEYQSENLTNAKYTAGTLAMANTGTANSNGGQFFIVYKDITSGNLAADYTPFGTITSGLGIVQNVAKGGTSCSYSAGGGAPKEKVIIDSVTIKKT